MKTQTLIILSLLFVFSCKCHKMDQNNAKMTTVEPVLISKGNLYGSGSEGIAKQNTIIETQRDWERLMEQMNSVNNVSEHFTETKIDFSKYAVIAVFNDVKGSGGYAIDLDISKTSEKMLVTVKHSSPKGKATSVLTQPYYIVKIAKQDLPIVFQ
ncbi:protease complex subunit PrcB family protein [Winogradskyella sp. PC D3.3]